MSTLYYYYYYHHYMYLYYYYHCSISLSLSLLYCIVWTRMGLGQSEFDLYVISPSEVICSLPQNLVWLNHKAHLSITIDGMAWSNEVLVTFVEQPAIAEVEHIVNKLV